ncbi:hypothetical protein [Arthrobacter flavus]|uniref:Uncharacterized protein n=1 Tax=Arthrobacter flavus TaxID=95172 RepID=A0ABW4Q4U4_9MICC
MTDTTRLAPDEPFPDDLTTLESSEVMILNSRIHRELDAEYVRYGLPDPETEGRLEEITEELDRRENQCTRASAPQESVSD